MRKLALLLLLLASPVLLRAAYDPEPEVSTAPIGSSYYRHLAQDMNIDLRELVKFEKRGFGRTEIVSLILISQKTGVPLKDYGKRRLKDRVTMEELAKEAKLDYETLTKEAQAIKVGIEAKGDTNLPPPLFEKTAAELEKEEKEKKK